MSDRGHDLLAERIDQAGPVLLEYLGSETHIGKGWSRDHHYWTTGVGSSEAHARFLASRIRRAGGSAGFIGYAEWLAGGEKPGREGELLVFSQGLSANAMLVMDHRGGADSTTLFTAETTDALRKRGKDKRADWLTKGLANGLTVVNFPLQNEYEILLRVIGPLAGYAAALKWLRAEAPVSRLESAFRRIEALSASGDVEEWVDTWLSGAEVLLLDATLDYFQNLAYKRMEGIFREATVFREAFQFGHGPFQLAVESPRPQWILGPEGEAEAELRKRVGKLCKRRQLRCLNWSPILEAPYSIFEYEMFSNRILAAAIRRTPADQRHWPGQGEDGELYDWGG